MKLLEIKNLHTYFDTREGLIKAVNGVSLNIESGRTLGILGESGCGKSQLAMSILQLFEENQRIYEGEILFEGKNISNLTSKEMSHIRGNDISIIFQDPMSSLNPIFKVGDQISEVLMLHQKMTKKEARLKSIEILETVKLTNPKVVSQSYPFQLSGGMAQRVMIAMAIACQPKLLIADEPTTSLDSSIQSQILKLMKDLKNEYATSIMFITHDLSLIPQIADDVVVMYCGQVIESAPVNNIFQDGEFIHPYTQGLMKSIPSLKSDRSHPLEVISGFVPHPLALPKGCKFAPRCIYATDKCHEEEPALLEVVAKHFIRCFYPVKKGGKANEIK